MRYQVVRGKHGVADVGKSRGLARGNRKERRVLAALKRVQRVTRKERDELWDEHGVDISEYLAAKELSDDPADALLDAFLHYAVPAHIERLRDVDAEQRVARAHELGAVISGQKSAALAVYLEEGNWGRGVGLANMFEALAESLALMALGEFGEGVVFNGRRWRVDG